MSVGFEKWGPRAMGRVAWGEKEQRSGSECRAAITHASEASDDEARVGEEKSAAMREFSPQAKGE